MTTDLSDKVLLISGAASGIARATALGAARSGAAGLVLVDRDATGLGRTAGEIRQLDVAVEEIVASVTDDGAAERIVGAAVDRFGRLDAAVNAAGTEGATAPMHECTDEEFDRVIELNLRAVFRAMRAQLVQMYAQEGGSIVNVSSASVYGVHAVMGPYVTSKAGVLTLSRVAAKEAGPRGVRVNAVCPGLTDTPMLARSFGDRPDSTGQIAANIPLGRFGRPDELAAAILWLCSDGASFTNGTALVVDGGRTG